MKKIVIALSVLFLCSAALADTQDYIKGKVLLIKSRNAYFNIGEGDGVAVGESYEIYYDNRVVANGKIAWVDRSISKSEPLDSLTAADISYYEPLVVKIRMFVPQANRGGYFNVTLFSEPNLEPANIITPDDKMVARLIHRGLISKDINGNFVPDIAGDYEIRDLTYTFYIDPEAKFHSGKPIESSDISYSFEKLASSPKLTPATSFILEIKGADEFRNNIKGEISGIFIIDKKTIAITLIRPFPKFEEYLAGPGGYIIPKMDAALSGGYDIGAGLFKVKWRNPEGIVLDAFTGAKELPLLDSIKFVRYNSLSEAGLAFELGKLDLISMLGEPPPKFLASGNYSSQDKNTICSVILGVNWNRPYQKGYLLSKALSFLIDRETLVRVLLGGEGTIPTGAIPGYGGVVPMLQSGFVPDSADFFLNSIAKKPSSVTLYIDSAYPVLLKVARFIEGQIQNKGIDVVEKTADFSSIPESANKSDLDLYLTYYCPVASDPDCILYPLYSPVLSGQSNYLYCDDTLFADSLEILRSADDPARRDAIIYYLAQSLGSNPPAEILYLPHMLTLMKADISGIKNDPAGFVDLRKSYLETQR